MYDEHGRNYKGQDEISFILQPLLSSALNIKTDIIFQFVDRDEMALAEDDIVFVEETLLVINQPITQVTSVLKVDLPSGYNFTSEGYKPYEVYCSSHFEVPMLNEKYPSIKWVESFEFYGNGAGGYNQSEDTYEQVRLAFSDYIENILPNAEGLIHPTPREVPEAVLDNFGAEMGLYSVYKD